MNTKVISTPDQNPQRKKSKSKKTKMGPVALDPEAFNRFCDEHKHKKNLLIKDTTNEDTWTSQLISEPAEQVPVPFKIRKRLRELARQMYEHQVAMSEQMHLSQPQSAKDRSMETGATGNILLGLMNRCFKNPVYTLKSFMKLVGYINPKKKHDVRKAFEYIQTLLRLVYLPKGYMAKEFECHSFTCLLPHIASSKPIVDQQLILWYFEDQFRLSFKKLVDNLNLLMQDAFYKVKFSGVQHMSKLLAAHPSQEPELILSQLINKLGDPLQKVAGSSIHIIRTHILQSPQHNCLLVAIIDEFLHRTNLNDKAKYYGLCLLKDVKFRKTDGDLAMKMIKMYTKFFTSCMKKGDVDNRFMSVLLTGMNRAYPYVEQNKTKEFEEEMMILYKLTHIVNLKIAFQAMSLIYAVISRSSGISDRFYQLLYFMVFKATTTQYPLKNNALRLIYQAMLSDPSLPRLKAFIKRLLQSGVNYGCQQACAYIIIISNVIQHHEGLKDSKDFLWKTLPHHEAYNLNFKINEDEDEKPKICRAEEYDWNHRNPLYAGSNLTDIYELSLLEKHCHPSARTFTSLIMSDQLVECEGNPLTCFSLTNFFDRMANKKPKPMKKNLNVFAPKPKKSNLSKLEFGSERFKSLDKTKLAPEERFIYTYYSNLPKSKASERQDEIDVNEDDDLFERIIKKQNLGHYLPDLNYRAMSRNSKDGDARQEADSEDEQEIEDMDDVDFDIDDIDEDNMEELGSDNDEVLEFGSGEEDYDADPGDRQSDIEDSEDGGSDFEQDNWSEIDDDEEEDLQPEPILASTSKKGKKNKKANFDEDYGIFGDGLSQMMEEDADDDARGTSEAILNKDRSNKAQLRWEEKNSRVSKRKSSTQAGGGKKRRRR